MTWFKIIKNTYNPESATPTIEYFSPPLKRFLSLPVQDEDIPAGEWINIDLDTIKVDEYLDSSLQTQTSTDSYIVVYEDISNEQYFIPVKSKVINGILYFQAAEDHLANTTSNRQYSIYYGLDNVKYIEPIVVDEVTEYIQVSDEDLANATEGDYYNPLNSEVNQYQYLIGDLPPNYNGGKQIKDSPVYKLALFNNGIDWKENASQKPNTKAYGLFDGPAIKIFGRKGSDVGKFTIKIYKEGVKIPSEQTIVLEKTEVDCYQANNDNNSVIFEKTNLEYNRYIFEIETSNNKNVMSNSNSVVIYNYNFDRNYFISVGKEQVNPDISFVSIGGIR